MFSSWIVLDDITFSGRSVWGESNLGFSSEIFNMSTIASLLYFLEVTFNFGNISYFKACFLEVILFGVAWSALLCLSNSKSSTISCIESLYNTKSGLFLDIRLGVIKSAL